MATHDDNRYERRFRSLSRLAIEAARGEAQEESLRRSVAEAVATMGLMAGSVRIYGAGDVDLISAVAGEEAGRQQIFDLERTLFADLRRSYSVRSLYMTLDLDGPSGIFSYPLRSGKTIIGNISGISRGERNLAVEEDFVASLAAMIILLGRTGVPWSSEAAAPAPVDDQTIRIAAVTETAAAVNHEINNPLMALVGNLELLLRKPESFPPDALAKLERIREAAERIQNVTRDLMRIREPRSVPYPGGGRMIDIEGSPKKDQ